ncbi:MAG: family 10 glycosylhydrolase [Saprospiraceae bacterium]
MKIIPFFYLLGIVFLTACQQGNEASELSDSPPITRGVWLTNVDSEVLNSSENIKAAVDLCIKNGINSIFTVTWNRGYTLYPSPLMEETFGRKIDPKFEGRDPLRELINYAHQKNIKVYAWFEFGFSSSYKETDGGYLLQEKPAWAALDTAGQIVSKNGFQWMNAFNPEVQDFLKQLVLEVVNNYEVDGIQGDDRLPALPSLAGYNPEIQEQYFQETGQYPPKDIFDTTWVQWRADILSDFQCELYQAVKANKPEVAVTVSPSIYPWSKEQYLQDWPAWVNRGCVDMVCPQIYRYDFVKYQTELAKIMTDQIAAEDQHLIVPGILLKVGDYYADTTLIQQKIDENRKYGLEGEVFFFYEGMKRWPDYFEGLYR